MSRARVASRVYREFRAFSKKTPAAGNWALASDIIGLDRRKELEIEIRRVVRHPRSQERQIRVSRMEDGGTCSARQSHVAEAV
jgi:hypothetical protein